jgi:hypothetical protein
LKAALDSARGILRTGHLASPSTQADAKIPAAQPVLNEVPQRGGGVQSLAEEYRRMLAEKAAPSAMPASGAVPANVNGETESPVDRVLRIIPGTVIN